MFLLPVEPGSSLEIDSERVVVLTTVRELEVSLELGATVAGQALQTEGREGKVVRQQLTVIRRPATVLQQSSAAWLPSDPSGVVRVPAENPPGPGTGEHTHPGLALRQGCLW